MSLVRRRYDKDGGGGGGGCNKYIVTCDRHFASFYVDVWVSSNIKNSVLFQNCFCSVVMLL